MVHPGGTGLDQWTVDELSVLTNMTVEGGLMTGLVEPCDPIRRFLAERDESLDVEPMLVYPTLTHSTFAPWSFSSKRCPLRSPRRVTLATESRLMNAPRCRFTTW